MMHRAGGWNDDSYCDSALFDLFEASSHGKCFNQIEY